MSSTKVCPYCAEDVRVEAVKCKHCGSYLGGRTRPPAGEWVRSDRERMIAGVCGGLAVLFGLPTAVVRLAFVLGTFLSSGFAIVIYIVLWIVMPLDADSRRRLPSNREDPGTRHDPETERELGE